MPKKNDLSALKVSNKNTLTNLEQRTIKQPAGRKPKPTNEKQSELVWLRFTPSEYAEIKKKAGLVPVATYLKNILINKKVNSTTMHWKCIGCYWTKSPILF